MVASLENISSLRSQRQIHFLPRTMDRAHQGLGSKRDFSLLPTRTSTYSSSRAFTFQPCCHFILRLQRLGPAEVTPDSILLFHKKGAQCQEQARKGEGRGREGKGRERRRKQGRREARSLVILLLSTLTITLYLTHAFLRC